MRAIPLILSALLLTGAGQTSASLATPEVTATPAPIQEVESASAQELPEEPMTEEVQTMPEVVDAPILYEYPLPQSEPVGDEWFADAVVLGDSRTEGLLLYSGLKVGLGLSKVGLNVSTALNRASYTINGKEVTLDRALRGGSWSKVYIMLGINEAAWMNKDKYYSCYCGIIDVVRQELPDAQIYIQTIPPVSAKRSAGSGPTNAQIAALNALIVKMCGEKEVYLVDVASVFTGPDGCLPAEYSSDGLHFKKAAMRNWIDYLECHTVQR